MVAFTALVSAISMALLATTASAVPTVLTSRQWPPPTSTVLDFTLYKTTQPGNEGQCWDGAIGAHVAPSDIGACNKADFYTFQINTVHPGYDCQGTSPTPTFLKRFSDPDYSQRLL
jgi:hypothetical protein